MATPSLAQANRRKWWIAVTSVIENLMFAAVLLGWSSLLLMLKNEGFYANLCLDGVEEGNTTTTNNTSTTTTSYNTTAKEENDEILYTPSGYPTCDAQDEILNRYFTIGSCLLSGVTMILGVIMDKYGSRMIRLTGTWAFMISCLLFALGSMDTENYSVLIAPAVCLNGMGGVVYIFTSFPVPNLFEDLRSTMISLMIGSYSASAVMYMIFKAAYDAGVPFVWLMIFHACIGFLTFLNCYFNTPGEPIPGPDDISYAIKLRFHAFRFEHKITGKEFLNHTSSVGRRMSSVDYSDAENRNYLESALDLGGGKKNSSGGEESFLKVLTDPCILLSFLTMSLTQLRLIAFMGWLELYLKSSAEKQGLNVEETSETVDFYTFLFGLLQINCFLMAPVIGTIMDWNLKQKKKKAKKGVRVQNGRHGDMTLEVNHDGDDVFTEKTNESNGKPNGLSNGTETASAPTGDEHFKHTKKKQQVMNLFRAFLLTNILLTVFGILIMFDTILPLQIVSFFVHTAVRTFLHSSIGGLYACMFHFSHFGKLTGLASLLSALFILIQDPLFVVINSSLGGDPFWINMALLIFTVGGFGLPFYLWRYARNMGDYQKITEHKPRKMFTINEEEEIDGFSQSSSFDEEGAPMVSSLAIAL